MRSTQTVAALVFLAALAGCTSTPEPAAAPTTPAATTAAPAPSASPTSTEDGDRWACQELGKLGSADFDGGTNLSIGTVAEKSTHPGMAAAGKALAEAASAKQTGTVADTEANLNIAKLQITLAEACDARFGTGNW